MHQASVGVHCPECVSGTKQKVYTRNTMPSNQSVVTKAILGLNIAAFAAQVIFYGANASSDGTSALTWALWGPAIGPGAEWWRVISSGFMHFGVIHLGMNMFALYQMGRLLEARLGPVRYALAYAASLVGGSFGALLLEPNALTMGASGAIFGLLGLLVVMFRSRGIGLNESGLGPVLLINVFISFSGFVSLGGHAGGFVVGALLGVVYFGAQPGAKSLFGQDQKKPNVLTGAAAVGIFVACILLANSGFSL